MANLSTISGLQSVVHDMAVNKGWWPYPINLAGGGFRLEPDQIGAKLALIHSEVSEALEAVRDGKLDRYENPDRPGKPEGLPSELADIVIRVADLAGALGINLEDAIADKVAYNARRVHRHGGRAL